METSLRVFPALTVHYGSSGLWFSNHYDQCEGCDYRTWQGIKSHAEVKHVCKAK